MNKLLTLAARVALSDRAVNVALTLLGWGVVFYAVWWLLAQYTALMGIPR
ncbi:hypothetical protein [Spirosoma sp. 209]|nr:hypothetical protein [Spirosoma sp. 209]